MSFNHNLALSLKLEADGNSVEVLAGHIEGVKLNLNSYGHSCSVHFSGLNNDDLDKLFISPKIISATLVFKSTDPNQGDTPLLEIKGIVTDKYFRRMPSVIGNFDQTVRMYEIILSDAARVIWGQHFPIQIYVDETMKDVIEKHKDPEISIKYDWDVLEKDRPIIAFSLEHKPWLSDNQQANFYSFIMWYLHQENGIWSYDYKNHGYTISGKKGEAEGDPTDIYEWLVNPPFCQFPPIPRFSIKEVTHSSDLMSIEEKENEDSFKSVKREVFDTKDYRCFPEHTHKSTSSCTGFEQNEVDVEFVQFDEKLFLDKLVPGSFVCFKGDGEGNWTRDPCYKDKTYRVRNIYLQANKSSKSQELLSSIDSFEIYVKAKLEHIEETFPEWPAFIPPTYPFSIQGKIFSDMGDEEQTTYKILESKEAPQGQYLVQIPLVGEEKRVVLPFTPDFMNGQHYFPLCKGEKVLLSIYFGTAKIQRTLDWQPLARLPMGIQGNQIVFASNGKDKYMVLRHEYENGEESVCTLKQSSSEKQTQTLQFKENELMVTVSETDKITRSIHFNENSQIVISFEDKAAGVTQQTIFDGKAMTHTCKGSEGTSVITQKPDSIAIKCKEFNVVASEKINLKAEDSISIAGKNKANIEAKVINAAGSSVKLGN